MTAEPDEQGIQAQNAHSDPPAQVSAETEQGSGVPEEVLQADPGLTDTTVELTEPTPDDVIEL